MSWINEEKYTQNKVYTYYSKLSTKYFSSQTHLNLKSQADIRNPLSLLAHNRITALQFVRWSLPSPPDTRNSPYLPLSALQT